MFTYFPFDSGAGADVTEGQWRKMAMFWLDTGVLSGELNEFEVVQHGAGDMSVDLKTGKAWIRGHYVESDATANLPVADNNSGDPRIDRVILRADFVANTITPEVLEGTPAGSPTAPALTQSSARWEIPLALLDVADGATSVLTADITDDRQVSSESREVTGIVEDDGTIIDGSGFTVAYVGAGKYDVTLRRAFPAAPIVLANPSNGGPPNLAATINNLTTTGFRVLLQDGSTDTDGRFIFFAKQVV